MSSSCVTTKGESPFRQRKPVRLLESERGADEGGDEKAVPIGEHFVVQTWPDAPIADRKQPRAHVPQLDFLLFRSGRRGGPVEDDVTVAGVVVVPIAGRRRIVETREQGRIAAAQRVDQFIPRPDVELALYALAVGVERGEKRALGVAHLARQPTHRLAGAAGEQPRQRIVWCLPVIGDRTEIEELGGVVEHLFEMRDEPSFIHRIAGEAAAQVVVDAALGHALQGKARRVQPFRAALPDFGAPTEIQAEAGWEIWVRL